MKQREAFFANHQFILDDNGQIVGVEYDRGEKRIMLGNRVLVKGDCRGYITPGITTEGYGTVAEVSDGHTDHYFGVAMDSGEFGFLKDARIAQIVA